MSLTQEDKKAWTRNELVNLYKCYKEEPEQITLYAAEINRSVNACRYQLYIYIEDMKPARSSELFPHVDLDKLKSQCLEIKARGDDNHKLRMEALSKSSKIRLAKKKLTEE
jgi:hypothetical protein